LVHGKIVQLDDINVLRSTRTADYDTNSPRIKVCWPMSYILVRIPGTSEARVEFRVPMHCAPVALLPLVAGSLLP
jgi:hypothetical protein